eukprot:m.431178 g.431178  ORF g.431178 m.431178 type:complete len:55 (+) comp17268_c0_seq1:1443-1607(+)
MAPKNYTSVMPPSYAPPHEQLTRAVRNVVLILLKMCRSFVQVQRGERERNHTTA